MNMIQNQNTDHGVCWLKHRLLGALLALGAIFALNGSLQGADERQHTLGWDPYFTLTGYGDVAYRNTQFFEDRHNTAVGVWDARLEFWLPPFRTNFAWGPYVRFAGLVASQNPDWENHLSGAPGVGGQVYPFSIAAFDGTLLNRIFRPLRLFAEYNHVDYFDYRAPKNDQPDEQERIGAEYWREFNGNDISTWWWAEIWSGFWWQSSNNFDPHYDDWIFANSGRAGARIPNAGLLSAFSPYIVVESNLSDKTTYDGNYYWENKLTAGGGIRFTPPLSHLPDMMGWLNRFVIYAEYVHDVAYYRQSPTSAVPVHDIRVGINFSIGDWYH